MKFTYVNNKCIIYDSLYKMLECLIKKIKFNINIFLGRNYDFDEKFFYRRYIPSFKNKIFLKIIL
ncbi:hypothetical protein H311_02877 [Anncaliia algerae PRA109]|nr:hypothetical protein H311_02877 [Anncaliia algerae PRA109]